MIMIYLKLDKNIGKAVEFNENSGSYKTLLTDSNIENKTIGTAFKLDNDELVADYNHNNGRVVQVGKVKWLLSDKKVQCTYRRFFNYEFFTIRDGNGQKFKIKLKSRPAFLKGLFDPMYDELDKSEDYFFYNIWSNWKFIHKTNKRGQTSLKDK